MDPIELALYRHHGHLTVDRVFTVAEMDSVTRDIEQWGEAFLGEIAQGQRAWYLDEGVRARAVLRKLDNPHAHCKSVRTLARDARLVSHVESVLGAGVSVYFSQIFFKAAQGGAPKPAHQDNFYFGPTDVDGVLTAWVALDDATLDNGCLYFGEGSQRGPVYRHHAPEGEPFNLQLPASILDKQPMAAAPVMKGGVSFHHGSTIHQSGANHSLKWRRACALHYVRNDVEFATPALPYDTKLKFKVS